MSVEHLKGKLKAIGVEIGELVESKNATYGSSFEVSGDFLKLLYPSGIRPDEYGDALLLVRIFDKQMRIATNKHALGESPYRDIAGYGILGAAVDIVRPRQVDAAAIVRDGEAKDRG